MKTKGIFASNELAFQFFCHKPWAALAVLPSSLWSHCPPVPHPESLTGKNSIVKTSL